MLEGDHTQQPEALRSPAAARKATPLFEAAAAGHASVVEMLLADPRVDPTADGNEALRVAAIEGHCEVVEALLKHPRVDPSAAILVAMNKASKHTERIALRLLHDDRVDPAAQNNLYLRCAAAYGLSLLVEHLLRLPRVDPAAQANEAIRNAAGSGSLRVVKLLLADPRVDPGACASEAVGNAADCGLLHVIERLLVDPRVDASASNNAALRSACEGSHIAVVERLVENDAVWWPSDRTAGKHGPGGSALHDVQLRSSVRELFSRRHRWRSTRLLNAMMTPFGLAKLLPAKVGASYCEDAVADTAWGRRRAAVTHRARELENSDANCLAETDRS